MYRCITCLFVAPVLAALSLLAIRQVLEFQRPVSDTGSRSAGVTGVTGDVNTNSASFSPVPTPSMPTIPWADGERVIVPPNCRTPITPDSPPDGKIASEDADENWGCPRGPYGTKK